MSGERYTETWTPNKREASPESAPFSPTNRLKRVKKWKWGVKTTNLNVRVTLKDIVL